MEAFENHLSLYPVYPYPLYSLPYHISFAHRMLVVIPSGYIITSILLKFIINITLTR